MKKSENFASYEEYVKECFRKNVEPYKEWIWKMVQGFDIEKMNEEKQ